jgi:hypothetical protein
MAPRSGSLFKNEHFAHNSNCTTTPNCTGLIYRDANPLDSDVAGSMAGFAYRCPNTALNVQGFTADDPGDDDSYVPVTCIICTRVHLVNPRSGKVVGADDESAANT